MCASVQLPVDSQLDVAVCGYSTWLCVVIPLGCVWLFHLAVCGYSTWLCVVIPLGCLRLFHLAVCGYSTWLFVVIPLPNTLYTG